MQLITKISKDDYYSILKWWDFGVPHVEKPTDIWFDYVSTSSSVICLCLNQHDEIKAYCQADITGRSASILVVSNPKALRKGFALKLLSELQIILKKRNVTTMEASVEIHNKASYRLAEKFDLYIVENKNSEPGFLQYAKKI